jgi:hypothetical protein
MADPRTTLEPRFEAALRAASLPLHEAVDRVRREAGEQRVEAAPAHAGPHFGENVHLVLAGKVGLYRGPVLEEGAGPAAGPGASPRSSSGSSSAPR